ncbi:hypothetical protein AAAU82_05085 [Lachnospira eligens]|uniref:hypothetical protein n=1 Tax=Lachnospira eligens TaxID=39485 RepID=UPI0032C18048
MPKSTIRGGTTERRFRMIMPYRMNLYNDNKLLMFPIKDLTETNPVYILTNKEKAYVEGTDEFKNLFKNAVEDLEVSDR